VLTARVELADGSLPEGVALSGSVRFAITGKQPVIVPLGPDGVAVYRVKSLSRGQYTVTAEYSGDANVTGSTGGPLQIIVDKLRSYIPIAWA
jgi:hypothetical protein